MCIWCNLVQALPLVAVATPLCWTGVRVLLNKRKLKIQKESSESVVLDRMENL